MLGFLASEQRPRRVAILGNAAGTTSRAYEEFFPRTHVDGVEIDPELSEIGRRFFDMNNPRLHLHHEDARPFMRRTDALYDQISLDTYRQPYIPFYLTTREFFETLRERLRPAGAVIINVGHPEGENGLEKALSATLGDVFPTSRATRSSRSTRCWWRAACVSARPGCGTPRVTSRPPCTRPRRGLRARSSRRSRVATVYTDDRAPVEWLIDKSIVDYAAGED